MQRGHYWLGGVGFPINRSSLVIIYITFLFFAAGLVKAFLLISSLLKGKQTPTKIIQLSKAAMFKTSFQFAFCITLVFRTQSLAEKLLLEVSLRDFCDSCPLYKASMYGSIICLALLSFSGSIQEYIEKQIQVKGTRDARSCVRSF